MEQIHPQKTSFESPFRGGFHLYSSKSLPFSIVFLSLCAFLLTATQNLTLTAYDAQAPLDTARQVTDSLKPGIAHLVGSELPLSGLLALPFIWIEPLYTTGLAGILISMLAYVGATVAFFRLASLVWGDGFAPWLATLVFALNPNLLYLQSTPMTEPLFLCTTLWAVYAFIRWMETDQLSHLLSAAFFLCLATLTRYEAWLLPPVMVGLIGWRAHRQKWTRPQWEGTTLTFLSLAGVGIAGWLLCQTISYGNPLHFLTGEYGILARQAWLEVDDLLPTKGHFPLSFVSVIYIAAANSGFVLYVLFVMGLCVASLNRERVAEGKDGRMEGWKRAGAPSTLPSFHPPFMVFLLLFVPVLAHLIAVFAGLSTLLVPGISGVPVPAIFKARDGLLMLPAVALFAGALGRGRHRLTRVALVLIIIGQYGWMAATGGVVALNDATKGWSAAPPRKAEQWLAAHYDEGLILVDAFENAPRFRDTRIPLSRFIMQSTDKYWQESLADASRHASWLWISQGDRVWKAVWGTPAFKANFRQVFNDQQMLIYRRK